MSPLIVAALLGIVAMASVPSTSALLYSPLLLRGNPWIVAGRRAGAFSHGDTIGRTPHERASRAEGPSLGGSGADFGRDDDLMRYKHELMRYVYEKSLTRGFSGDQQGE